LTLLDPSIPRSRRQWQLANLVVVLLLEGLEAQTAPTAPA
jgi:hypothetical protein